MGDLNLPNFPHVSIVSNCILLEYAFKFMFGAIVSNDRWKWYCLHQMEHEKTSYTRLRVNVEFFSKELCLKIMAMHWCMQKRNAEATEPDSSWLPTSDDKGVDDNDDVYDFWD